jgi:hypothetical protein
MRVLRQLSVWLVAPAVFVVHLVTLSPTVGLIDSGELALGVHFLNILHPTGYPLYTMLGRLASMVPIAEVVNRAAVLSALLAAVGVGLFLWLLLRMGLSRTAAGVSAALLGLSFPVWAVAVDVEVYSLTLVFVVLLWLVAERSEKGGGGLLLLAYLAGLAMTNHMTAAAALLGVSVTVIVTFRKELARRIPVLSLVFLLGLTPYLFLVLRARAGPVFSWGDPGSLERFWWHVTGKQYQVWMFSQSMSEVMRNAGRGAGLMAASFVYVLVPVVVLGAVRLFRSRPALAWGFSVSAVACFAYAVNYSIPDIESYYITGLVALMALAGFGLEALARRMGRAKHLLWVCALAALALNYRVAGKQGDYVARDHTLNVLASAAPNATILTDWWDFYSPVLYLQDVEKMRTDVCVIDKELLRRSWYFRVLERAYPWLMDRSRQEIDAYLEYLDQFEHGRLKAPEEIQRRFIAMLESFIARSPERPAYTTYDELSSADAKQMMPWARRVPVGMLFELRTDTVIPPFDYAQFRIRMPAHNVDMRTRANLEHYRFFVVRRAQFLAAVGRTADLEAMVAWYRAQPVGSFAPLPTR